MNLAGPGSPTQQEFASLAALDVLLTRLIEVAAPVEIQIAQSEEQRQALYRFRYSTMVEEGWCRPEDLPDGMEYDSFDDRSFHITAWNGRELVGTGRLVFPQPGLLLPSEEACGMGIEPRGFVVDGGRTAVSRAYRGSESKILLAIIGRLGHEIYQRGYLWTASMLAPGMMRLYRHLGLDVEVLGAPSMYMGVERYPVRYSLIRASHLMVHKFGYLLDQSSPPPVTVNSGRSDMAAEPGRRESG